jgi:hypothetical protein
MPTVRQFVHQSYRLISASNPTVPLHGDDLELGILVLNQLMQSYAATGLMLTIATTVSIPLAINQSEVVIGPATFLPLPDITIGRLANYDSSWLLLDGVTYPLIQQNRDEFLAAWKFDPLEGLPRFAVVYPDVEVVRIRLYPAPSQFFEFNLRGKFQKTDLDSNDTLDGLPDYYIRYLLFALARDVSLYKGRAAAWTPRLEQTYVEAKDIMESASEVNTSIVGDRESLLNGAWRVRAGI